MNFFGLKERKTGIQILSHDKSDYNDIYVLQNGDHRELWFKGNGDFFLQSRVDTRSRQSLMLVYSRMMLACLLFNPNPRRILMIGLGGAAMSNWLHRFYPETEIDVVEVDHKVIEISKKFFYLEEAENYRVHAMDGRLFVQSRKDEEPYDLICLDAFKSGSIPFHLKTLEFYQEMRAVLVPGGVVASNLYGKNNKFKPNDWRTFSELFRELYCFEDPEKIATVLIATDHEKRWTSKDFLRAGEVFPRFESFSMKEIAALYREDILNGKSGDVFNDDFTQEEFLRAVEKNNDDRTLYRPYPIRPSH